mmetsp:Transcript_42141/g.64629  ORF Transcript_42141/g.64629 Transcript_42141/m.64629 type:complete len:109 (+) Transcript_42141:368-694(+)|eukprot:CAMPEP_0170513404 /NCGR_PEP_ID=MMETSP0208-20121228/67382_1 /TAXON_ID=197538 /ORGANISM="Strombidium inclinatum, Strain S3" /LENGTH=108 /DNA_ID=CAMNT_0010797133 /DNA_START=305 /DNA_END=631 /DNA_ORIENTATION=-
MSWWCFPDVDTLQAHLIQPKFLAIPLILALLEALLTVGPAVVLAEVARRPATSRDLGADLDLACRLAMGVGVELAFDMAGVLAIDPARVLALSVARVLASNLTACSAV